MAVVAVVDTNIWVSAFLNPRGFPDRLVEAGKAGQLTVVMSPPMLEELLEVLCRPRIMKIRRTTPADAEAFVRNVAEVARLVPVSGDLRLCRDPDDECWKPLLSEGLNTLLAAMRISLGIWNWRSGWPSMVLNRSR